MRLLSATGPRRTARRVARLYKRYNLSTHLGQAVTHDADWSRDLSRHRGSRRFETVELIAQGRTNAAIAREMVLTLTGLGGVARDHECGQRRQQRDRDRQRRPRSVEACRLCRLAAATDASASAQRLIRSLT
jgi:hypothetical protein